MCRSIVCWMLRVGGVMRRRVLIGRQAISWTLQVFVLDDAFALRLPVGVRG